MLPPINTSNKSDGTKVSLSDESVQTMNVMNAALAEKFARAMSTDFFLLRNTIRLSTVLVVKELAKIIDLQTEANMAQNVAAENAKEAADRQNVEDTLSQDNGDTQEPAPKKKGKEKSGSIFGNILSSLSDLLFKGIFGKLLLLGGGAAAFLYSSDTIGKNIVGPLNDLLNNTRMTTFGEIVGSVKDALNWVGDNFGPEAKWAVGITSLVAILKPLQTLKFASSLFSALKAIPPFLSGIAAFAGILVGMKEIMDFFRDVNVKTERERLNTFKERYDAAKTDTQRTNILNEARRNQQTLSEVNPDSKIVQDYNKWLKDNSEMLMKDIFSDNTNLSASIKRYMATQNFDNLSEQDQKESINNLIEKYKDFLATKNLTQDQMNAKLKVLFETMFNKVRSPELQLKLNEKIQNETYTNISSIQKLEKFTKGTEHNTRMVSELVKKTDEQKTANAAKAVVTPLMANRIDNSQKNPTVNNYYNNNYNIEGAYSGNMLS